MLLNLSLIYCLEIDIKFILKLKLLKRKNTQNKPLNIKTFV